MTEVNKPNFLDKVKSLINRNAENYEDYEQDTEKLTSETDNFDSEDSEFMETVETNPAPSPAHSSRRQRYTSVTTSTTNNSNFPDNVIGMPGVDTMSHEIVFLEPHSFQQMVKVIEILKQQKTVVLNFTVMDAYEAQRSVDFVAGGAFAMDGHQKRIGDGIFLFTPRNVNVNDKIKINLDGSENQSPDSDTMGLNEKFPDSLWDTPPFNPTNSVAQ